MNWIKNSLQKANENSNKRNIQLQFLWILVAFAVAIISYKLYSQKIILNKALISYGFISLFAVVIYFRPIILKPILLIWLMIGLLLGEITSTIILGIVYYLLFFPITFIIRIFSDKSLLAAKWYSKEDHKIDYQKLF